MSSSAPRRVQVNPSYPRPTVPSSTEPVVPPPPFIPYSPPPHTSFPPTLPHRPAIPPLPAGWTRTAHIVPAAYPRRFADSLGALKRESQPFQLELPKEGETKEERLARNEGEARECVRRRYDAKEYQLGDEQVVDEPGSQGGGLYMAAERWTRDGRSEDGVTLVVTHANGFHKESWHPTIRRLLDAGSSDPSDTFGESSHTQQTSKSSSSLQAQQVDEVWFFDDVHHAASIDLNEGRIGGVHGWSDGGRDIVNFLQHVYHGSNVQYVDGGVLEWQKGEAGGRRRKVIGVGHSVGGNALVQAAAENPSLFHALFLVEPMCPAHHPPRSTFQLNANFARWWYLALGAIKRRTQWATPTEAAKVRTAPFFASWHEEVWALYLEHGLVPASAPPKGASENERQSQAVQLATPSWAEACVFGEATGIAEGWDRLAQLEIPVGFLMAGDNRATQGDKMTSEMVWRARRSTNERIMDGGHLLVHEKPDEVANALHRFIGSVSSELQERFGSKQARAKL